MSLNEIAKKCLETAEKSGFSPKKDISNIIDYRYYLATKVALIHSEASEMLEAIRNNDFEEMVEEAIDVLIRTFEYLACLKDVDIDKEIDRKMLKNTNRPYMHGGKIV